MVSRSAAAQPQVEYDDPTIEYPSEDDEPLAETKIQYIPLTYAVSALDIHLAEREDAYVAGDNFVYYRMNDPSGVVAPDVYVVFGARGKHPRDSWIVWREGNAVPSFVLEIASQSTWRHDETGKRDIYARMGVLEYWRFDPTGECFSPALVGERLADGEYLPMSVALDADGMLRGRSKILGLDICVSGALEFRLYDPVSAEWLTSHEEDRRGRLAAEAQRDSERQALEAARQRIRELEAQLRQTQTPDDQ